MTVTDFLLPVFVEVLLMFVLLGLMGRERLGSLKRGEVKSDEVLLSSEAYTSRARQYGNCFANQFELPVLFLILIAFILITRVGDLLLLVLAWVFVISRLAHAYVHTTSNILDWRFKTYGIGTFALAIMWIVFALKILTGT